MEQQIAVSRDLTKWPRLLVVGDPITEEQANEIIMRTTNWGFHINDNAWLRLVHGLTGISLDKYGMSDWRETDAFEKSIGNLGLEYLSNSRVASSYIGGPHGWCDWDGTIGCADYNIGKWPEPAEILEEWQKIAAAFPFLSLRSQLVPNEGQSIHGAAVEFTISNGEVEWVDEPEELLTTPKEFSEADILRSVFSRGGERGVSLERLKAALDQVRQS